MEKHILEIAHTIEKTGLMKPGQCIVNEYYHNQGISPHIDSDIFGSVILGVSIGDDAMMTFEQRDN